MIRKTILLLFVLFSLCLRGYAQDEQTPANAMFYSEIPSAPVEYSSCLKNYQMPYAELFQRTLSAISASNYKIIEIQSKSSRVLFSVFGREFWACVTKQNSYASTLRIIPSDNSFYFRKDLIDRIFNDIEANSAQKIIRVDK